MGTSHSMQRLQIGIATVDQRFMKSFKLRGANGLERAKKTHHDDCYFCCTNLKWSNCKNKKSLAYPDLPSARRPTPHGNDVPVPVFTTLPDLPIYTVE